MPTPTLMHFEEDATKINKMEQRNESLRNRLALLIDKGPEANVTPCSVEPPPHLLDDFYIIAQENNSVDSQAKSLKSLIRNIVSLIGELNFSFNCNFYHKSTPEKCKQTTTDPVEIKQLHIFKNSLIVLIQFTQHSKQL